VVLSGDHLLNVRNRRLDERYRHLAVHVPGPIGTLVEADERLLHHHAIGQDIGQQDQDIEACHARDDHLLVRGILAPLVPLGEGEHGDGTEWSGGHGHVGVEAVAQHHYRRVLHPQEEGVHEDAEVHLRTDQSGQEQDIQGHEGRSLAHAHLNLGHLKFSWGQSSKIFITYKKYIY